MYTIKDLRSVLFDQSAVKTEQFRRLFHGRGGCYEGWEFLTVDAIDKILSIAYYKEPEPSVETALEELFEALYKEGFYQGIVLQRRHLKGAPSTLLHGTLPEKVYANEGDMRFKLELLNNQNSGFFPDMKNGRDFVRESAKGKRVLNLFSYTCAFSVAALKGGAASVVNVDMSKGALEIGRENHRLNGVEIKGTRYMPYNILKSFSRIKKAGPYDLIIIDPPSFQKGSFAATKDYAKIIRRLKELASDECTVLSALNSPSLDSAFIKELFAEAAPEFHFVKRLENLSTFPDADHERSLKNLLFKNFND